MQENELGQQHRRRRGTSVLHGPQTHLLNDSAALPGLLHRAAAGDSTAFAEVYRITAPRLYGLVLYVLGQRDQAHEVAQEAFTAIWSTCGRFDPTRGSAMSWMLATAHRLAVDRVRSAHASTRRDANWARRQFQWPWGEAAAEVAQGSIEATRVRTALRSLTPQQRTAVILSYFGGQTHLEVAAALGIPESIAKTHIRDGLHTLNTHLASLA